MEVVIVLVDTKTLAHLNLYLLTSSDLGSYAVNGRQGVFWINSSGCWLLSFDSKEVARMIW